MAFLTMRVTVLGADALREVVQRLANDVGL